MDNHSSTRTEKKKIAYIMDCYPSLTTTFIDREILEVKRRGVDLVLVSIWPPSHDEANIGIRQGVRETHYILPVYWPIFLKNNLHFVLTHFWTYFSTVFYMMTRRHPSLSSRMKTFLHFAEGVSVASLLRDKQVNHIHAHFADGTASVTMVASRLLRVPYSITAHAYDIYAKPIMLYEKIANAAFATTCTAYNKAYLEDLTKCPVELVYHGLDISYVKAALPPSRKNKPPLILAVGALKEKKGFPYLIKACRILKDQGYLFICEIIGQGPLQNTLKQLIDELRLQDSVVLRGALPNAEVMHTYAQATLFVQASIVAGDDDRDGIPNVVLEAMLNYVPVVATRVSGIPEVIEDGITGLLVDPSDEKVLVQAMVRIFNDPELGDSLAREGRRRIEAKFNIQNNVDRLMGLFAQSPMKNRMRQLQAVE